MKYKDRVYYIPELSATTHKDGLELALAHKNFIGYAWGGVNDNNK